VIWGVTGCVGAGKSTVASILSGFGARVLDVDDVAAQALAESSLGLTAAQALTAVVTGGPERARIEAALIPEVQRRVAAWCAESEVPGVLDAALLFEHGLARFCSVTLCVCCPAEERRRRVEARSTTSARLFEAIESSQWPEAEKAQRATHQVPTSQPLEALTPQLREIWLSGPQR
jgi:dephospho-CoA kinase